MSAVAVHSDMTHNFCDLLYTLSLAVFAGTKLILNVLLDASVTIAKQAERASRLTCFVTETEETSASASHSSTSETASSVDLLLKPGSEADVTAEGGSGGGNSKGDDEDKSKVVPVSYLIKTKLVKVGGVTVFTVVLTAD